MSTRASAFLAGLINLFWFQCSAAADVLLSYEGFAERRSAPSIVLTPNGRRLNLIRVRAQLLGSGFSRGDTAAVDLKTGQVRVFKAKTPSAVIATERRFSSMSFTDNVALLPNGDNGFRPTSQLANLDGPGNVVFVGKYNKAVFRANQQAPFDQQDLDGDDQPNGQDNCVSVFNPDQLNADGDSQGNACDDDDDNDTLFDADDNCPLLSNADQLNTDSDLQGDACDADDDNDALSDLDDNCPLVANAEQTNTDGDEDGDACDSDDDNDGVSDSQDTDRLDPKVCADIDADSCDDCSIGADGFGGQPDFDISNDGPDLDGDTQCDVGDPDVDGDSSLNTSDNCPVVFNPAQIDSNDDGIGDACDEQPAKPDELCFPIVTSANRIAMVCL